MSTIIRLLLTICIAIKKTRERERERDYSNVLTAKIFYPNKTVEINLFHRKLELVIVTLKLIEIHPDLSDKNLSSQHEKRKISMRGPVAIVLYKRAGEGKELRELERLIDLRFMSQGTNKA
jgi:hypothetical protein